jgi:hypothetical protein
LLVLQESLYILCTHRECCTDIVSAIFGSCNDTEMVYWFKIPKTSKNGLETKPRAKHQSVFRSVVGVFPVEIHAARADIADFKMSIEPILNPGFDS